VPTEIERLYREHRTGLVRLVERELHDPHDAEDVVQTAFLDAQRALDRGTIPRNPRAWLAAIALNAARRLRRRRLNAEPLEEYAAQEASEVSEIRAALESLPNEQRTAVLYRDVLGLSYDETAEQMSTSVNAVGMLLHRGRERLRQTLGLSSGGAWLWRWSRRAGGSQVAIAKGAAAVVVAGGVATAGAVAAGSVARTVAPIRTDTLAAAAPAMRFLQSQAAVGRAPRRTSGRDSIRRRAGETHNRQGVTAVAGSTQAVSEASTRAAGEGTTQAARAGSGLPSATSTLRVPSIALTTPQVPTLPVSVPTAVTATTPIATVTVTTPTLTTATVTTPVVTVTLPVP
jgi:RNA polymerase sigma-70 factor, ECF subfamily